MTSFSAFDISPGESATLVTSTTNYKGSWYAITIIASATFNKLVAKNWDGDSTTGLVVGAGQIIYGSFTEIQLSSGAVIAYKR